MFEYSLQLSWPSEYESKSSGYLVDKFTSNVILTRNEILLKIKNKKLLDEIKESFYIARVPKNDSSFPFQSKPLCKSDLHNCSLITKQI